MAERSAPLPKWLWILLAVAITSLVFYELRGVLSPIFLSLGIAYLLDPLVDRFEARGIPRGAAITIVLTILALVLALFVVLVIPSVIREVVHFASDLPGELAELRANVEPWLLAHGIPVPHDIDEALQQFAIAPSELATHAAEPVQAMLRFVLGGTVSVIGALASTLIVPVLAFYLLYDFDRMTAGARDLIPPRVRPWVVQVASEIDEVLGQFVRGQLLVMLAMGVLYASAYSLAGVRLALPIGLVAGLLAFIPYVGSGAALTMGLLMCAVDWTGWTKPLLVIGAYAVCQFLEGFVIVPRIVGDKVGLPAVWVLVALMIGADAFGFLGVLLAVPAAAVVKIFVLRGVTWYRQSPLYLEGEGALVIEEVVRKSQVEPMASVLEPRSEIAAPITEAFSEEEAREASTSSAVEVAEAANVRVSDTALHRSAEVPTEPAAHTDPQATVARGPAAPEVPTDLASSPSEQPPDDPSSPR